MTVVPLLESVRQGSAPSKAAKMADTARRRIVTKVGAEYALILVPRDENVTARPRFFWRNLSPHRLWTVRLPLNQRKPNQARRKHE